MANSQNGYPASENRNEIGVRTLVVPETDIQLPVRDDVSPQLLEMARWFGHNIEPLKQNQTFGYAFKFIAGTNVLSNHSSGTAIDLNSLIHPFGRRGTVPEHMRAEISRQASLLGLRWGGNFGGNNVDEMHFEIIVPLAQALEIARKIRAGIPLTPVTQGMPTVRRGSRGDAVRQLQEILNRKMPDVSHLAVDGIFGSLTEKAVLEFQRREHIGVDGVVGPVTWSRLLT
jgi:hypothetical protein